MVRRYSGLVLVMFLIMFVVSDSQRLAMASDGRLKIEHDDELPNVTEAKVIDEMPNETETRAIELLEPILDPTVKPIELLEPILDPTVKPIELLEPILNPTIKLGELLGPELSEETKIDGLKVEIKEIEQKLP